MSQTETKKPVHEIRLGSIKAAIWANDTQNGVVRLLRPRRPVARRQSREHGAHLDLPGGQERFDLNRPLQ